LQTLQLGGCDNLERLPKGIRNMINLRVLEVTTKHTFLLESSVGCLNLFCNFVVVRCPSLKCLFEGMDGCLANLRTLVIDNCPNLTSLSLSIKHLTSLEILIIDNCEKLSLTEGEASQDLKLGLQKLRIDSLQKLAVLPQWLHGSANTLQHLEIEECYNFTALPEWLPSLKSLQTLLIIDCPKLSSLPEGMQGLTALRKLMIRDCPNLSRKLIQEDWHKIAHVPDVDLDEDSGCSSEIDDDMSSYLPEEDDEGCTSEEHDEVRPSLSS
jgi:Leucine-rich repeat (LRR) protein